MKASMSFRPTLDGGRSQLSGLVAGLDGLWPDAATENLALALAVVRHRRLARLVTDGRFATLAHAIATMSDSAEDEALAVLDNLADDGS